MKILWILLILLCSAVSQFGQSTVLTSDISSIIPGISTCRDIERITGKTACAQSRLEIEDGTEQVSIYFQNKACESLFENDWRFKVGTVIAIIKNYSTGLPLKRLSYSLDKMTKSNDDINTYYHSIDGTISITIQGDLVISIWQLANPRVNCVPCRPQGK